MCLCWWWPHLSLLADDGDGILQPDIMEKALEKNIGHSYKVVVLLRFVEWITVFAVGFVVLRKKKTQKTYLLLQILFSFLYIFSSFFLVLSLSPPPLCLLSSPCSGLSYPPVCSPASLWSTPGSLSLSSVPGWPARSLWLHATLKKHRFHWMNTPRVREEKKLCCL